MSSEWLSAEDCVAAGLAWRVCAPERLLDESMAHPRVLAAKPIASLVETKRTIVAELREPIALARELENETFQRLMGTPANVEALTALGERRQPDFIAIDEAFPPGRAGLAP